MSTGQRRATIAFFVLAIVWVVLILVAGGTGAGVGLLIFVGGLSWWFQYGEYRFGGDD